MAAGKAWNVTASASWILSHAYPHYIKGLCGGCAKAVRMAIEAGGVSTAGRPIAAKDYRMFLPRIGFNFVTQIFGQAAQASWSNSQAKQGDIAVMNHGVYGHICMWAGGQWVSDYLQGNKMWAYSGDGMCYIFRYNGQINLDPSAIPQNVTGPGGMSGATLLGPCPPEIEFKRLWAMYRRLSYREGMTIGDSSSSEFAGTNIAALNLGAAQVGLTSAGLNMICGFETGHGFGYSMSPKDLNGYDNHDAGGHRTFGYGLLFHPIQNKYMDQVQGRYTQHDLEQLYLITVKKKVDKVHRWKPGLQPNQVDSIVSGMFNFGDGFLGKSVGLMIRNNPNDMRIYSTWCHLSDAQGRKYPGLIARRHREADHYFGRG